MTKENRFEGLMGAVGKNKNAQTSKSSDVQKSSSRKKAASRSSVRSSKNSTTRLDKLDAIERPPRSNVSTSKQLDIQTSETPKDDLDKNIQTVKQSDAQTSKNLDALVSKKAKSVNPDYTRTTLYLPKKMHKKLKAIALEQETEMSSIVEELIEGWLNSQS